MPQMMPMYWMLMTITTMTLLIIIMSFMYFLMMNPIMLPNKKLFSSIISKWNWKW